MSLISVITPLLNRAGMLPEAMASVAAQGMKAEHIVVDGGSTDGSQEIARAAGAMLVDAPGSTIYEAINIGLAQARGAYIWLLNSDDVLTPGAFDAAHAIISGDSALDFVRGRARVEKQASETWVVADAGAYPDPAPTLRTVLLAPPNINACLFRTASMRRLGPFDTKLAVSADRAWMARALMQGARAAGIDRVVYAYRAHEHSLTIGGGKAAAAHWVKEHLAFARALLVEAGDDATRRDLRAFFGKETAHAAALALAAGDLAGAGAALGGGFRADPLWPLHAAGPLAEVAARRLRRS